MVVQQRIEKRLNDAFHPTDLQVLNESSGHNVPAGSETHFKVIIVSEAFAGLRQVQRQRRVYQALNDEFRQGLHALSMQTLTPAEWQQDSTISTSPRCLGGGKR